MNRRGFIGSLAALAMLPFANSKACVADPYFKPFSDGSYIVTDVVMFDGWVEALATFKKGDVFTIGGEYHING